MYGDVYDPEEPEEMKPCPDCTNGQVRVWRDSHGNIDYISGKPTDELIDCSRCNGTGEIEENYGPMPDDEL